jgi:hypothetical protein
LHVLGTPPALILSQDQTLEFKTSSSSTTEMASPESRKASKS